MAKPVAHTLPIILDIVLEDTAIAEQDLATQKVEKQGEESIQWLVQLKGKLMEAVAWQDIFAMKS